MGGLPNSGPYTFGVVSLVVFQAELADRQDIEQTSASKRRSVQLKAVFRQASQQLNLRLGCAVSVVLHEVKARILSAEPANLPEARSSYSSQPLWTIQ